MKKNLLLSLFLVLVLAFSCENTISPIDTEKFSIKEITVGTHNSDYLQSDSFSYDADGKLASVARYQRRQVDFLPDFESVEFQYNGTTLASKTHRYSPADTIHRKVSYTYLPNGALHQALHAYTYSGSLEVQWINTYEYNADGTLNKQTSVNPNSLDTESVNKYFWENGNVSKIETYYNDHLNYESYLTYDRSINYRRGNPFFHDHEVSLATQNNIIEVRYVDHSGLLDVSCNPCSYSYEYNDYNLPTKITGPHPYGTVETISYNILEDDLN